jgi:hypothetical protein
LVDDTLSAAELDQLIGLTASSYSGIVVRVIKNTIENRVYSDIAAHHPSIIVAPGTGGSRERSEWNSEPKLPGNLTERVYVASIGICAGLTALCSFKRTCVELFLSLASSSRS